MSFAAAATGSAAAPRHGLPHAKESVRRVHSDISETDEVERLPSLQIRDRRREMMMKSASKSSYLLDNAHGGLGREHIDAARKVFERCARARARAAADREIPVKPDRLCLPCEQHR